MSFIWGKKRAASWETASQIALRDCSKEPMGEGQYIRFLRKGSPGKSSAYFTEVFCQAQGADVTIKGFSDFSRYEEMQGLES